MAVCVCACGGESGTMPTIEESSMGVLCVCSVHVHVSLCAVCAHRRVTACNDAAGASLSDVLCTPWFNNSNALLQ